MMNHNTSLTAGSDLIPLKYLFFPTLSYFFFTILVFRKILLVFKCKQINLISLKF